MPDPYRDDSPTAFSLSRRRVLLGAAFLAGSLALSTLPALSAETGVSSESTAQFMEISTLLIPHRLDADIGKRMAQAMGALRPSLPSDIAALLSIAKKCNARIVEDFFPDIPEGPLKQTALAIISAWYMGVLVDAPDAEVFAYEQALMYRPTRDVMTIPSYAKSGPNGWNAEAPPLTDMPRF
ncbi:sorbitol dehydrogenase family protein [Paraburkholderia sp. BL6669N2]|uniref:sorbitol dehydrogenase family protein n=1 Tax=Paraburkholderia sp. BL6669N2 TaxID=1938807 RepID=UPI000E27E58F|nr:sorbitol dehydrogenase family protein [Paraburkholderia sp. BL6669N2]